MRIIAVDDEKLALDALLGSIRKAAPEAEVYAFRDAVEALDFLEDQPCEVAFLDVEMPEINGVELAKRMKMIYPNINIIFSTGYDQYRGVAFGLHASGYLTKPILPEDVRWELEDLRRPVQLPVTKRIRVQTFGNFEVFLDGLPIRFKYERTKEMLAYLVDRAGAYCTNGELMGILFENDVDFQVARALSQNVVSTPAFAEMDEEAFYRASALLRKCSRVIDAGTPVGPLNRFNGSLLQLARDQGIPICTNMD